MFKLFRKSGKTKKITPTVEAGLYRHFKGASYIVLGTAKHSETDELVVVYSPEQDQNTLWVRPVEKFVERVNTDSGEVPRFLRIENDKAVSSKQ